MVFCSPYIDYRHSVYKKQSSQCPKTNAFLSFFLRSVLNILWSLIFNVFNRWKLRYNLNILRFKFKMILSLMQMLHCLYTPFNTLKLRKVFQSSFIQKSSICVCVPVLSYVNATTCSLCWFMFNINILMSSSFVSSFFSHHYGCFVFYSHQLLNSVWGVFGLSYDI